LTTPASAALDTTQRGLTSHSSSCSSTRWRTESAATQQPSIAVGGASAAQSPPGSASRSMVSRKAAPWATGSLPDVSDAYCAHFRRVLPMSIASSVIRWLPPVQSPPG